MSWSIHSRRNVPPRSLLPNSTFLAVCKSKDLPIGGPRGRTLMILARREPLDGTAAIGQCPVEVGGPSLEGVKRQPQAIRGSRQVRCLPPSSVAREYRARCHRRRRREGRYRDEWQRLPCAHRATICETRSFPGVLNVSSEFGIAGSKNLPSRLYQWARGSRSGRVCDRLAETFQSDDVTTMKERGQPFRRFGNNAHSTPTTRPFLQRSSC